MKLDKIIAQLIAAELRAVGARSDLLDLAGLVVGQAVKVEDVDGEAVVTILDERGNPRIGDAEGNLMTLPAYIAEMKANRRRAFMFDAPAKPPEGDDKPEPAKPAETMSDAMARTAREAERAEKAKAKRNMDSWPNPWMKGSENLTRQMTLENIDPARARAAKAAAGVA